MCGGTGTVLVARSQPRCAAAAAERDQGLEQVARSEKSRAVRSRVCDGAHAVLYLMCVSLVAACDDPPLALLSLLDDCSQSVCLSKHCLSHSLPFMAAGPSPSSAP